MLICLVFGVVVIVLFVVFVLCLMLNVAFVSEFLKIIHYSKYNVTSWSDVEERDLIWNKFECAKYLNVIKLYISFFKYLIKCMRFKLCVICIIPDQLVISLCSIMFHSRSICDLPTCNICYSTSACDLPVCNMFYSI